MKSSTRQRMLAMLMCVTVIALTIFSVQVDGAVRRIVPSANGYSLVFVQAGDVAVPMPEAPAVQASGSAVKDYVPPVEPGPVKGVDCSNSSYSSAASDCSTSSYSSSSVSTYMVPMTVRSFRMQSSYSEVSSDCSGGSQAVPRSAARHEAKAQKHAVKAGLR